MKTSKSDQAVIDRYDEDLKDLVDKSLDVIQVSNELGATVPHELKQIILDLNFFILELAVGYALAEHDESFQ